MSIFTSNKKPPKKPPQITLQELQSIRQQVKLNPLAGKGVYTIEELENDAIVAHWNILAAPEADEESEVLELKKGIPEKYNSQINHLSNRAINE